MDSLIKKHAEIVKKVLSYYAQFKPSHGEIEVETVFDDTHQHYEMVNVGWDGVRRVHGSVCGVVRKLDTTLAQILCIAYLLMQRARNCWRE